MQAGTGHRITTSCRYYKDRKVVVLNVRAWFILIAIFPRHFQENDAHRPSAIALSALDMNQSSTTREEGWCRVGWTTNYAGAA